MAKETVYGSKPSSINQIQTPQRRKQQVQKGHTPRDFPKGTCPRCGRNDHKAAEPHKDSTCNFCHKTGHLQSVCLQKKRNQQQVKIIKHRIQTVKAIKAVPQIQQVIQVNNKLFTFEVDTGTGDNFCAEETWKQLGKPRLSPTTSCYEVANGHPLPALGVFSIPVVLQDSTSFSTPLTFTVTKVPRLNLLGRDAIIKLGINVSALMGLPVNIKQTICPVRPISQELKPDAAL